MKKGNVLVIGNSGVGKSMLINAVLGESVAKTGIGTKGTTVEVELYDNETAPFRVLDTQGFEPSFMRRHQAIHEINEWSKSSVSGDENHEINVIWFCIDGTAGKLFPQTIKALSKATKMWKSVPVIVVITKSFSKPERDANIALVQNAFATQKRFTNNLKAILPVVSSPYYIDEDTFAPPYGISELIEATNNAMPEGFQAAKKDISAFTLTRKRTLSHSIVIASSTAGAAIGAAPIGMSDALPLSALEFAEVNAIAAVYGVTKYKDSADLVQQLVETGTASMAAKAAISALKAIPAVNIAASTLNAIIAASFVAAIGETAKSVFESVYLGEKSPSDIAWARKLAEDQLTKNMVTSLTKELPGLLAKLDNVPMDQLIKEVIELLISTFNSKEAEERHPKQVEAKPAQ